MIKYTYFLLALALAFSSCKLFQKSGTDMVEETEIEDSINEDREIVIIEAPDTIETEVPYIEDIQKDKLDNKFSLYYQRTACFGTCPVFEFRIDAMGNCHYHGINFVDDIGHYEGAINLERLSDLKKTLDEINYFEMDPKYDAMVSDLPATITEVKMTDKQNRVYDRYHGPDELQQIYDILDELISAITWTAKADQK